MTIPVKPIALLAGVSLFALSACETPIDLDLRKGGSGGTAAAARTATAQRPAPDDRGIISYPGYQVVVARRGDTLADVAARIGVDAQKLAKYNGIKPDDTLRRGEIIALPNRVAEPAGGPITPGGVDISSIAGAAIDKADAEQVETSTLPASAIGAAEPVRHKVARGETAYTIARLYNVSIRSLADWNGLGADFAVREGQYLLIPVALPGGKTNEFDPRDVPQTAEAPGEGSPTPLPPSSDDPLPKDDTVAVAALDKPANAPGDAPDLGTEQAAPTPKATRMSYPVKGDIIREYSKGKNDGIDISASPGAPVKAADSGVVAAITEDTNGTPIIVVKHANNLLTVYSNVEGAKVKTGERVKRGQALAAVRSSGTPAVHFQVRDGFESLDPVPFLTN